ncbi:MAG TPA: twin-arginine translocase TatA/TatE family subunit [Thermomicrobiaceae bacterium]|nr:twin-arginine translocase TatA/TatE family subunit [Thermomicrobiaceae bacterium]
MPLHWPDLVLILMVVVAIFVAGKIPEISGGLRRTLDNLRGNESRGQAMTETSDDDAAERTEPRVDRESS